MSVTLTIFAIAASVALFVGFAWWIWGRFR